MTTTTPALDGHALIEAAGKVLAGQLRDRTYVDGFESNQANYIVGVLDGPGRTALLAQLVSERLDVLVAVDMLLDEVDERSYAVTSDLAARLIVEIVRQDREELALQQLTTAAIVRESDFVLRGGATA